MTDIASLGIKIDASTVDEAGNKLDTLANKGENAEAKTKQLSSATQELAARVGALKASVDPFGAAQDRVNAELAEANTLFKSGAISAADYAQAQLVLNARAEAFSAKQDVMNARLIKGAGAARLTAAEGLNLSRQFADIGVSAAMGMNPLMILIQQGPQIADIMRTSGLSIKDVIIELLRMAGIVRVVEAANDNAAASATANAAANAELAASNEAVAASATHAAGATGRMASATGANAVASRAAAAGATEATAANGAMGASATAAGNATRLAMGPAAIAIAAVVAVLSLVAAGFAIFAKEANKAGGESIKHLNLTEKQLDRLKEKGTDTAITMGDSFNGFFKTVKDILYEAFEPQIKWMKEAFGTVYDWIVKATVWAIKAIVGGFVGGVAAVKMAWQVLPGALGDIAISTANAVIGAIESMVNGAIQRINALSSLANTILPAFMQIGMLDNVGMGRIDNPYSGQAAASGQKVKGAFDTGYAQGGAMVDSFGKRWSDNASDARDKRVTEDAGKADPVTGNKPKTGGQSDAEKEYEQRVKDAKEFADALKLETSEIGKNAIELKHMAAARAAAKAPTAELALAIINAQTAWEKATANEALRKLKEELTDNAEAMEFETKTMGMNNEQRAVAMAQREIDLKLRQLERDGIEITAKLIEEETKRITDNARARGALADATENARQAADDMRAVHDSVREATDAFGELFGTAGQGFADLINVITSYKDTQLEAEAAIAAAREKYGADSIKFKEEEQRQTEKMARAEMDYYGDMIGAAKRMFKEKSTGWKILEAVERAYRAYQMISMIIEAANVAKSIVLDGTKTASSVSNSGIRAAADGVAAIAKTIASLPFPLNLIAGAAVAAALIAFGVKVFGGKGGGGAIAESEAKQPTYSGPVDEYGAPTSSYSVLRPGRTTVANDNGQIASAPGMAAGSGGGSGYTGGNTYVTVQGSVDADVMPQFMAALDNNRKQTVEEARQAVAEDNAARAGRQRIGGS